MAQNTPPKFAVNVQDPWAQAIIHGPKRIENRSQRPPDKIMGERVAIYCTKTKDDGAWSDARKPSPDEPWHDYVGQCLASARQKTNKRHHPGCIIGTVRVVGFCENRKKLWSVGGYEWLEPRKAEKACLQSPMYCDPDDPPAPKIIKNPWWLDATPCGWLLDDPQPLDEPVPVDGSDVLPGVWTLPDELRERVGYV